MKKFLDRVAEDLYARSNGRLDKVCVVFPNKRAAVFFTEFLKMYMDGPGWLPQVMTIEEFLTQHSSIAEADPLLVNFELYKLFSKHMGGTEDFDQFYSWGNMLAKDFDEADKYLVNPDDMFRVMLQEKEIVASFNYLTDEQVEIIKRFWSSFSPPDFSDSQNSFLRVWEVLRPVYHELNDVLRKQGLGYQGMIYREVAERARRKEIDISEVSHLCFVGFHILTEAETIIFHHLQKSGKVLFYWDVDNYYIDNEYQEAGKYLRKYLQRFKSAIPVLSQIDQPGKSVEVVGIPLQAGQAKFVGYTLKNLSLDVPVDTAIVLPDENLLFPVLQSLPASVDRVNVTMGYPLRNTNAYSLVNDLIEVQRYGRVKQGQLRYYYKPFFRLLSNPLLKLGWGVAVEEFVQDCREKNRLYIVEEDIPADLQVLKNLFLHHETGAASLLWMIDFTGHFLSEGTHFGKVLDPIQREFIFQVHTQLKKLNEVIYRHRLEMKKETLYRILRQDLKAMRIPFSGEPLGGLQVMGLLETRNLDFKNLFILDMNEGVFPSDSQTGSFIPFHLRKGFGLPTYEHQDAMYAYYFYRLLHHAEKIYFLYNTQSEGQRKSEISRYITQLNYESDHKLRILKQSQPFRRTDPVVISIPKDDRVLAVLKRYQVSDDNPEPIRLSPSAFNSYLDCRLKFYYRYVAGIHEPDTMIEEIDHRVFGNLIHDTMEFLYLEFLQESSAHVFSEKDFEVLQMGVDAAINKAFQRVFQIEGEVNFVGDHLVIRDVVRKYVEDILKVDSANVPFRILSMEENQALDFPLMAAGSAIKVRLGGRIDRLDEKDGRIRILDYKTGREAGKSKFSSIGSLFEREDEKRGGYVFQVMLYAYIIAESMGYGHGRVQPGLMFVREMKQGEADTRVQIGARGNYEPVDSMEMYAEEFRQRLEEALGDLMDPSVNFDQVENLKICESCSYRELCHR